MADYPDFYMDGFQAASSVDDLAAEWSLVGFTAITTDAEISGRQVLRFTDGGGGTTEAMRAFSTGYDYVVMGVRLNPAGGLFTGQSMIRMRSGSTNRLRVVTDGTGGDVDVVVGAATTLFSVSGYFSTDPAHYEVEVYRHATDGFVGLYRDGTLIDSFAGDTTGIGGTIDRVGMAGHQQNHTDFYCAGVSNWGATEGGHNIGVMTVLELAPTADVGTPDFTPLSGTDNFAMADELPNDGDTSHNESGTAGHEDLFTHGGLTGTGTIFAVGVTRTAKKSVAGISSLLPVIVSNANREEGVGAVPGANYRTRCTDFWLTNPDGDVFWDAVAIDALQFGYKNEDEGS